jgi:hypothetical protein
LYWPSRAAAGTDATVRPFSGEGAGQAEALGI